MATIADGKLETFFNQCKTVSFHKYDVLLTPSEDVSEILYLKSGVVKMSVYSEEGEEVILHTFREGAYFPVMLILSDKSNPYYFTALEVGEYQRAPAADVVAFLKGEPEVLFDLTRRFAFAVLGLTKRIEEQAFGDAYQRTRSLLQYLASRYGKQVDGGIEIDLEIHHQDLAAWLGLRRETVSRQIEKLQEKGLVRTKDKHFLLPDVEKMKHIS